MAAEITPLRAVTKGVLAAGVGTATMTAAQAAYYKATGAQGSTTPAEVAKRIIRGVLQRDVSDDKTDLLNNVMHWSYGSGWGVVLGVAAGGRGTPVLKTGALFGLAVWGASLVQLPAMKLAPPPWKYTPAQIAPDVGFHLVYGVASGVAFRVLGGD